MRVGFIIALLWAVAVILPAQAEPRPFRLTGGQIVIDVSINGRVVSGLLDTGATRSLIETGLAKELGLRLRESSSARAMGVGSKGVVTASTTQTVRVDVGAGERRQSLGTYPEGLAFAHEGVQALIGMDLLRDLALSIDFEAMTIDVQAEADFKPPADAPLLLTKRKWKQPTLTVQLAGVDAELVLDTAASVALHLDEAFVARTKALSVLPASRKRITGLDGVSEHAAIVVPHVAFAGATFADVQASSGPLDRFLVANHADGVMGIGLLKHFHAVIDFANNRVWLRRTR